MEEERQLTDDEKLSALKTFLQENERIDFSTSIPIEARPEMLDRFAGALLTGDEMDPHGIQLCGKSLTNDVRFELYPGPVLPPDKPMVALEVPDAEVVDIVVNVPMQAGDLFDVINEAVDKGVRKKEEYLAEHDPAMPLSKTAQAVKGINILRGSGQINDGKLQMQTRTSKSPTYRKSNRPSYDIHAPTIRSVAGRTHVNVDLWANAHQRESEDKQVRFVWETKHRYLLSDEALHTKTPGRWFHDMCVLCGVSLGILSNLTDRAKDTWQQIEKERAPELPTLNRNMMMALGIVLENPIHAGIVGTSKRYTIPKGSAFGLNTITYQAEDGSIKSVVDPQELYRISMALLKMPPRLPLSSEGIEHELARLLHLASAYMQGAVFEQELKSSDIPGASIHQILQEYGLNTAYRESNKYRSVIKFCYGSATNILPVIDTLEAINDKHLHIDPARFERYMQALKCFPKNSLKLMTKLSPEEAFRFAMRHHEGKIGSFLRVYRMATKRTHKDVASIRGVSEVVVTKTESRKRPPLNLILTVQNPWQLPTDADGNIRADVVEYLQNFDQHKDLPAPESHWLTGEEALARFGGNEAVRGKSSQDNLSNAIAAELKKYPGEAYALVTLPDGKTEALVRNKEGEPPRLLDSEIEPWIKARTEEISAPSEVTTGYWQGRVAKSKGAGSNGR